MKQTIFISLGFVITVVALSLGFFLAHLSIRNQAFDGCFQAGKASFKNEAGQNVTVPDGYWYELCLKEKGLK